MSKERVAKWDNIRFFMIVCVVIGHSLYNFVDSSQLAKSIYLFIYTFHMPVFMFVAGLFSKHAVKLRKYERAVEYIIIYLLMKFLECFADYLNNGHIRFHFFWEDGPAWFALAMAVFLIVTMFVQDIDKCYLLIAAIVIGCLAGLDNHLGDHFASMRICVFYPAFLAGFYIDPELFLMKDQTKSFKILVKICSFLFLNLILIASLLEVDRLWPYFKLLKGKFTYAEMGYGMKGVLIRLACYVLWACTIAAVIMVNAERECIISWLGTRTMSVFIWHNLFIVLIFKVWKGRSFLQINMPHTYIYAAMCIAVIISIITAYLPSLRMPKKRQIKQ